MTDTEKLAERSAAEEIVDQIDFDAYDTNGLWNLLFGNLNNLDSDAFYASADPSYAGSAMTAMRAARVIRARICEVIQ